MIRFRHAAPPRHAIKAATWLEENPAEGDRIIQRALDILESRARAHEQSPVLGDAKTAADWLRQRFTEYEREVFAVAWLDRDCHLLAFHDLFFGTFDRRDVHPREMIQSALECNAVAAVFAHHQPFARIRLTACHAGTVAEFGTALGLIGIRALDHFIVGPDGEPHSMVAKKGGPTDYRTIMERKK